MKPARNPFLRSNRPVRINPYSPQARGLDHLWPLQGNHYNPISQAQVAGNCVRSWSERGSHFNYTSTHFLGSAQPVSFGITTSITISMWARAWSNGASDSKMITLKANGLPDNAGFIHIDANGTGTPDGVRAGIALDIYQDTSTVTAFTFDGTWHNVVAVWDSDDGLYGRLSLYVDGVYGGESSGLNPGSREVTNTDVWIGYNHFVGDRRWEGDISDVRIYGRTLSAEEIWQQYIDPWDLYARPRAVIGLAPTIGIIEPSVTDNATATDSVTVAPLVLGGVSITDSMTLTDSRTLFVGAETILINNSPRASYVRILDAFKIGSSTIGGTDIIS